MGVTETGCRHFRLEFGPLLVGALVGLLEHEERPNEDIFALVVLLVIWSGWQSLYHMRLLHLTQHLSSFTNFSSRGRGRSRSVIEETKPQLSFGH